MPEFFERLACALSPADGQPIGHYRSVHCPCAGCADPLDLGARVVHEPVEHTPSERAMGTATLKSEADTAGRDGVQTLNSASIEGRSDGLSAIHILRCRHRRCYVGSTRRSPPAMLGQIARPGDTFHCYPFRRVSFDKSNVDVSALTSI